jgi:hypothetical protein
MSLLDPVHTPSVVFRRNADSEPVFGRGRVFRRNTVTSLRTLLIGKSQLVLDGTVAGLRDLGYRAEATNDFSDITGRFGVKEIDLVVFGGQVPPDRRAELREEISAINGGIIFVEGLAGIPGLIVNQFRGAFAASHEDATHAPAYTADDRSIRLTSPARPMSR